MKCTMEIPELQVHGYELTLRLAEAEQIENRTDPEAKQKSRRNRGCKRPAIRDLESDESIIPEKMNIHCLRELH